MLTKEKKNQQVEFTGSRIMRSLSLQFSLAGQYLELQYIIVTRVFDTTGGVEEVPSYLHAYLR